MFEENEFGGRTIGRQRVDARTPNELLAPNESIPALPTRPSVEALQAELAEIGLTTPLAVTKILERVGRAVEMSPSIETADTVDAYWLNKKSAPIDRAMITEIVRGYAPATQSELEEVLKSEGFDPRLCVLLPQGGLYRVTTPIVSVTPSATFSAWSWKGSINLDHVSPLLQVGAQAVAPHLTRYNTGAGPIQYAKERKKKD